MIFREETRQEYFSVFKELVVCGQVCRPAIRYTLAVNMRASVEALVKKGQAQIYTYPVTFMNGKPNGSAVIIKTASQIQAEEAAALANAAPVAEAPKPKSKVKSEE